MTLFGSVLIVLRIILPQRRKDAKRCRVSTGEIFLTLQWFLGVLTGAAVDPAPGKHARDFFDAPRLIEPSDAHLRAALQRFFLDHQMTIRKPRDLRLARTPQQ